MSHSGTALVNPYNIFDQAGLLEGMKVADLGCGGTGHFVFSIKDRVGDNGVVYAVDILKNILENINSRIKSEGHENIFPIWSDIENPGSVPIPEGSLDMCFLVNVMYTLNKKREVLQEISRLLKEKGVAVIVDWVKPLEGLGPQADQLVGARELNDLALDCDLMFEKNFSAGRNHYCLILRKEA